MEKIHGENSSEYLGDLEKITMVIHTGISKDPREYILNFMKHYIGDEIKIVREFVIDILLAKPGK